MQEPSELSPAYLQPVGGSDHCCLILSVSGLTGDRSFWISAGVKKLCIISAANGRLDVFKRRKVVRSCVAYFLKISKIVSALTLMGVSFR